MAYGQFWSGLISDPQKLWAAQLKAGTSIARIWETMLTSGTATQDDNAPRDRRFSSPVWSEDPVSRVYRDVFLALEDSVGELLSDMTEDSKDDMRVNFYTRQLLSALSPANYLATNPTAHADMIETKGASVLDGIENLLNDLERGDGRLRGDGHTCHVSFGFRCRLFCGVKALWTSNWKPPTLRSPFSTEIPFRRKPKMEATIESRLTDGGFARVLVVESDSIERWV